MVVCGNGSACFDLLTDVETWLEAETSNVVGDGVEVRLVDFLITLKCECKLNEV